MGDAPECTPSPSESTQPPSPARDPEVVPPGHSEGCARPLDTVPKKLCGYLSKFGGKGPIKGWKCRWFFYDERKCHLYYSRTAQDVNPLDSIDLSSAVFDCKADAEEEGTFEIKTPSRVITLKAATKQVMVYWLQQLQMKRWEFHSSPPALPAAPAAALAGNGPILHLNLEQEGAELEEFVCPVKTPTGLVGAAAAFQPVPAMPSGLQNISLKHLGTEIQNTMHNIRGNKQAQATGHGPLAEETSQSTEPPGVEQPLISDPNTPGKEPEEPPKPAPRSSVPSGPAQKPKWQSNTFPFFTDGLARSRTAQEKVTALEQQVLMLTKELKSQKELVIILHKALEAAQQEKRASSAYLAATGDRDRLELVRHKVRQIAELSQRVEALEQGRERLEQEVGLREQQVQALQQHVQLLMDKNQAKQQVICKLSQKLTEDLAQPQSADAANGDFLSQQERMEHLKDDMEAYQTQNRFLNSEIHQVTKIWRRVAEKEKALLTKCAYLQARNCQVESKYLAALRRLQEAAGAEAGNFPELLQQLIQEALQWEAGEASDSMELSPISEYDDYGFLTVPDYEVEDLKLLAKIQALEVRSHHLLALKAVERPLRDRWAALTELVPSAELKQLLRVGVPREHRPRVWRWLIHHRVQSLHSPGCYQELLGRGRACEHPAARQIELDLNRTFPTNKHFTCPTSSFPGKLRRVLLAFSWQNPTIGYCQGLNRLAAIALLVLEDEESAFWCLVAIVETILPAEYYSKTLTASQVDQRVLQDLLSEKLPRLTAHLGHHHIDLSLITFNWFLVLFADSLISDILLRVWDAFLYEGTKVVFRYALAIFKYNEEEILRLQDSLEIYQYLRFFTKTICDSRKLMNIAFNDMNPFPMKQLRQLRAAHRERLEAELRELELLKAEYLERRASRGRAAPEGCVSEDEGEGDG
ncbi:TBC1 domain family member 2A [Acomys russatus]|uniref:TBC1 domain family member 2A n=1 Tax=Acomys russatus TaxID=60746 RepID=UPI0021E1BFB4|nr:TBC1 domain family member 2A [Acomys russatus]